MDEVRKNDDLINKLVQTTISIEDKLEEIKDMQHNVF